MSLVATCRQLGYAILRRDPSYQGGDFRLVWDDSCWKHTMEYFVENFEAEVGFFAGVLGFTINTISDEYIMLTPPSRDFFSASPAQTPRDQKHRRTP